MRRILTGQPVPPPLRPPHPPAPPTPAKPAPAKPAPLVLVTRPVPKPPPVTPTTAQDQVELGSDQIRQARETLSTGLEPVREGAREISPMTRGTSFSFHGPTAERVQRLQVHATARAREMVLQAEEMVTGKPLLSLAEQQQLAARGPIQVSLRSREDARRAILASIILSPPKAMELETPLYDV